MKKIILIISSTLFLLTSCSESRNGQKILTVSDDNNSEEVYSGDVETISSQALAFTQETNPDQKVEDADVKRFILRTFIQKDIAGFMLEDENIEVTQENRDTAKKEITNQITLESTSSEDEKNSKFSELEAKYPDYINLNVEIASFFGALKTNRLEKLKSTEYPCMSHILISTTEQQTPEGKTTKARTNEEAETRANEVYQKAENGSNFKELAKEYSDDPGSKENGGELGCLPPDAFVPEFNQAVQKAKTNEIQKPFKSDFGWHVLVVTKEEKITDEEMLNSLADREVDEDFKSYADKVKIDLDPKYGVWDPKNFTINPPESETSSNNQDGSSTSVNDAEK